MLINRMKKLLMFNIPRTAGNAVYRSNTGWEQAGKLHQELDTLVSNGHLKQSRFRESRIWRYYSDYSSIAIARNPWDRVLSCYLYLLELTKRYLSDKHTHHPANTEWAASIHDRLISYGFNKSVEEGIVFDEDYSDQCVAWMDDGTWFQIETIDKLEAFLGTKLPRINNTTHLHYSRYYDQKTINIIYDRYIDDILKFGYKYEPDWKYTPTYVKSLVGDYQYFDSARKEIGEKYIIPMLTPDMKILDYGCGVLRIGLPLIKYLDPNNYYGYDISEMRLQEAQNQVKTNGLDSKEPIFTNNISNISIKFKFIWCYQVFIHLGESELVTAIKNIYYLLSHDGVCITSINVSTKYPNNIRWLEFPFVCKPYSYYKLRLREYGMRFSVVIGWGDDSDDDSGERLIRITKIKDLIVSDTSDLQKIYRTVLMDEILPCLKYH